MIKLNIGKLNHESSTLYEALGLDFYERNIVSNTILFELLSNHMLVKDLFDDEKDAPVDMRTMTGLLEKCVDRISVEEQKFYLLMIYGQTYEATMSMLHRESKIDKVSTKGGTKKDEEIKEMIVKLVKKLDKQSPFDTIMKVIKAESFDYERFMNKTLPIDKRSEINQIGERVEQARKTGEDIDLSDLGASFGFNQEDDE